MYFSILSIDIVIVVIYFDIQWKIRTLCFCLIDSFAACREQLQFIMFSQDALQCFAIAFE